MITWDEIKQRCPKLYQNGIVFECGPGWASIILDISLKIETILNKNAERTKIPEGEEIYDFEMFAIQVKEKYGTLRIYMTLTTDEIDRLIEQAEGRSEETCEACGAPGRVRGGFWVEVRCDKCFKEWVQINARSTISWR